MALHPNSFLTEDEVRGYLKLGASVWSPRLDQITNGVTEAMERRRGGPIKQRAHTRVMDGLGNTILRVSPTPWSVSQVEILDETGAVSETITALTVDAKLGRVARQDGQVWPRGFQNLNVSGNAGWADGAAELNALKLAALEVIKVRNRKAEQSGDDVGSISTQGQSVSYVQEALPRFARDVVDSYRVMSGGTV